MLSVLVVVVVSISDRANREILNMIQILNRAFPEAVNKESRSRSERFLMIWVKQRRIYCNPTYCVIQPQKSFRKTLGIAC